MTVHAIAERSSATIQQQEIGHQYLVFTLGGELFAIDILKIREIIELGSLTTVPMMPPTLRGVINLRGMVVPVIDLSIRFGRPATRAARRTGIVIIEVPADPAPVVIGVMVDAVNQVVDILPSDVVPPPDFGTRLRADFIAGMATLEQGMVILLEVARVFSMQELARIHGNTELNNAEM